tara:strand:+ start:364 stop:588 length:225 start_codon:yes stop_codon:yes gene_type:complete
MKNAATQNLIRQAADLRIAANRDLNTKQTLLLRRAVFALANQWLELHKQGLATWTQAKENAVALDEWHTRLGAA